MMQNQDTVETLRPSGDISALPKLIARLEAASQGSRELDAAITLYVEQQQWPHVTVRQLDNEDDNPRGPGSRRECLVREGGTDDWAIVHGGDWGATFPVPYYTTSLDAALTLVPEGWVRAVDATVPAAGIDVDLFHEKKTENVETEARGSHKSEAIATCIAGLKARQRIG